MNRLISILTSAAIGASMIALPLSGANAAGETAVYDFTSLVRSADNTYYGSEGDIIGLDDNTTACLTYQGTYAEKNGTLHLTGANRGKGAYENGSYVRFTAPESGTAEFENGYVNYYINGSYTGFTKYNTTVTRVELNAGDTLEIGSRSSSLSYLSSLSFTSTSGGSYACELSALSTAVRTTLYGKEDDVVMPDQYTIAYLTHEGTYAEEDGTLHLTGTNNGKGAYENGSYIEFAAPASGTALFSADYANYYVNGAYKGYNDKSSEVSVALSEGDTLQIGSRNPGRTSVGSLEFDFDSGDIYICDFASFVSPDENTYYGSEGDSFSLSGCVRAELTYPGTYVDPEGTVHLAGANNGKGAYENGSYIEFTAPERGEAAFEGSYVNYYIGGKYIGYANSLGSIMLEAGETLQIASRVSGRSEISSVSFTPSSGQVSYFQDFGDDGAYPEAWALRNYSGGGMQIRSVDDAPAADRPEEVSGYALNASASGSGNRLSFARLGRRVSFPDSNAELSFDLYMAANTTGSYSNAAFTVFTLGEDQRVSDKSRDTDLDKTFFALRESKQDGLSCYDYSAGSWVSCDTDFRDQWVKIKINVDFENKTAEFTVSDRGGTELFGASSSGITAETFNRIGAAGYRNGGATFMNIWLDNLSFGGTASAAEKTTVTRVTAPRQMERLGRGVIAIRSGYSAYIGWRSLASDSADTAFNIYRNGTKINTSPVSGSTNYVDSGVTLKNSSSAVTYEVRAVVNGVESTTDTGSYTLSDMTNKPRITVPLKDENGDRIAAGGGYISDVWVGDFTNNGEYDFLVARMSSAKSDAEPEEDADTEAGTTTQKLEAYRQDGTRLWTVDLGPNSISGGSGAQVWGSTQIFKGHMDGATVYDLDTDGYAEVIVRIANGVVFGDGKTFTVTTGKKSNDSKHIYANVGKDVPYTKDYYAEKYSAYASTDYLDRRQWIAVLDGRTGALKSACELPQTYIDQGPLMGHVGIGYLDGVHPGIVTSMKNRRIDEGDFLEGDYTEKYNMVINAFDYSNGTLTKRWETHRGINDWPDGHQIRIADVDSDGIDDFCQIGFVLNGSDGSLKYSLGPDEVVHGDRFYVGAFDRSNKISGYAIEQYNPFGVNDYGYNAATGEISWRNMSEKRPGADLGRGCVGDIDPSRPGFESWSFTGLFNIETGEKISDSYPYPAFSIWWDSDLLAESFHDGAIEKWDPVSEKTSRLLSTVSSTGLGGVCGYRSAPAFIGDIMGDWREEVVLPDPDNSMLIIASTTSVTEHKIFCLAQDPMYRNGMTVKGYKQNPTLDFYLGDGMETPAKPNITCK